MGEGGTRRHDERQDPYPNAILVTMKEKGVGLAKANKIYCNTIKYYVDKFLAVVKEAKEAQKYSEDLLRFLDGLVYSIGGSLVWSLTCPQISPRFELQ